MTTWTPDDYNDISATFSDALGQKKSVFFRVAAEASDSDIQALIAAMQTSSNMSIAAYSRGVSQSADDAPAAEALSGTYPYALLTNALDINESCGPAEVNTRLSILGPSPAQIIKVARDKAGLNPAGSQYAALLAAAQAVQTNTAGTLVVSFVSSQIQTRKNKSRLM